MCCKERRYFIDRRDRTWQWHIQRFRIKEPICKQYTAHKNDGGGTILAVNIFYIFHTRTSIQNACQLHSNVFIFKQPNCLKLPELLIPCAQLGTITDSKEQINDKNAVFFQIQSSPIVSWPWTTRWCSLEFGAVRLYLAFNCLPLHGEKYQIY